MISFSTSALGEPRSESRPLLHHHRADLDAALVSRLLLSSRITVVGTRGQAMVRQVAAISIGVFERETRLDLAYVEDQKADTDLNLVMGSDQGIIEVQGTAEGPPFSRTELDQMLDLGRKGIESLFVAQQQVLEASR